MDVVGRFEWDDENAGRAARHGVLPEEVEEVFRAARFTQRSRHGTYVTYGRSLSGRLLFVAWTRRAGAGIRVVTARSMTDAERKRFRKEVR